MNRRKRFIYNGIMLTLVGLAIRSVSIAFNSYITKTVGAEGIGLFSLIMNIYGFAITFATSGISLTVTRLIADAIGDGREGECRKIMRNAACYSLIFSGAAFIVLYLFSDYFSIYVLGDVRSAEPLRVLSFSLIPLSLSSAVGGYFVGVKRVAKNAAVQVLGQAFKIIATLWCIMHFGDKGAAYTVLGLTLSITLTEIFGFCVVFLEYLIDKRRLARGSEKSLTRFSNITAMALPLAFSAYIRSALLTLEHILIPKRLRDRGDSLSESLSAYGTLHGMALPMILYPMVTLSSFSGLLVPEFAERSASKSDDSMRRIASRAFELTLMYAILSSVVLFVFSEEIGYVVYRSSFAGKYISVLAPVIPIMYLDHVTDSVLKGIGEHVYSMWVNITDSLLSVALVWLLIPKMGIMGYAVCIIAMEGYNFILSALRLFKRIKFRISLTDAMLLPIISAFASGILVKKLFISAGMQTSPLWLTLEIVFSVCAFFGVYKVALIARTILDKRLKCNQ